MKHEPCALSWMEIPDGLNPYLTICEVLRQIYRKTEDPEIRQRALLACGMAKDLSKEISQLKGGDTGWTQTYWDANPDFKEGK